MAARMRRVKLRIRLGARRVQAVAEREWLRDPADLITIAAAAESVGAFGEAGWAALMAELAPYPEHAEFWTGLRDVATITGANGDGGEDAAMDPISDKEEPSDATEPTTRLERRGDVWAESRRVSERSETRRSRRPRHGRPPRLRAYGTRSEASER